MSSGRQGSIGIGKETTWGTAVAPSVFYNATESITEERGRLRESMNFGTRSRQPADAGRLRITGAMDGMHARPEGIGHLLRAALGAPQTTGASAPYTHEFTPALTKFSDVAALPPYSVTAKRGSTIHRYAGAQLNQLTLQQARDEALALTADWIAKSVADVADTPLVLETNPRFLFRHLAVLRDASAFPYVEDLTIQVLNNLETEEVLNESDEISAVDFGDSEIRVDMTLTFRDAATYADFKTNTTKPWSFTWTIDANHSLAIAIPRLNIESWSAPIGGPGRMTVSVGGVAEFDSVAGHEIQVTLVNELASY